MEPNSVPDIYLMKREKSRAGCMTLLIATLAVLLIVGGMLLVRWLGSPRVEPAAPVEFPEGPVQANIPPEPAPAVPQPPPQPAPAESAAPPATGDPAPLFAQARDRLQAGDHQAARQAALDALALRPGDGDIEKFLSELAMPLLASQRPMPEKVEHVVQPGDYLGKLAATYNTPVALIAKANNIQGATIRVGETLRLLDGNTHVFALAVSKSRNDLLVTLDGKFFKRYRVSTGENAMTPVGTFKIIDKIAQPAWHKPGGRPIPYGHPDNLLGTHWLALDLPGYGLHGTWEPDSIGRQTSAGCVRMLNPDIEELYTILPKGTLVTISD